MGGEKTERKEIKNEVHSKNERMRERARWSEKESEKTLCKVQKFSSYILWSTNNDNLHGINGVNTE